MISYFSTLQFKQTQQLQKKVHNVTRGDFGQWGDIGQFFNISVLFLYKEFLDEMFLSILWSSANYDSITSLWNSLYSDNTETLKNCPKSPRCPKLPWVTVHKLHVCKVQLRIYTLSNFKIKHDVTPASEYFRWETIKLMQYKVLLQIKHVLRVLTWSTQSAESTWLIDLKVGPSVYSQSFP